MEITCSSNRVLIIYAPSLALLQPISPFLYMIQNISLPVIYATMHIELQSIEELEDLEWLWNVTNSYIPQSSHFFRFSLKTFSYNPCRFPLLLTFHHRLSLGPRFGFTFYLT